MMEFRNQILETLEIVSEAGAFGDHGARAARASNNPPAEPGAFRR